MNVRNVICARLFRLSDSSTLKLFRFSLSKGEFFPRRTHVRFFASRFDSPDVSDTRFPQDISPLRRGLAVSRFDLLSVLQVKHTGGGCGDASQRPE